MGINKPYCIISSLFLLLEVSGLVFGQRPSSDARRSTIQSTEEQSAKPSESPGEQEAIPSSTPVLELFGHKFFSSPIEQAGMSPGHALPPTYSLGAGDQLGIFLGGKAQQQFEVTVSADGQIYVPTVGVFPVQGQTLGEFRTRLDERLRRYYSNYTVDVMLIAPKSVRVSVIGEVGLPGNYTMSALNTVLDAVAKAQGPTENGSLRDIQVFRGDSLFAHVDLYDFLLQPTEKFEIFLQGGDQVFVPVCKSRVEVTGEVYRPAIYELNPNKEEQLLDLIDLAGGMTDLAFSDKIELSRMKLDGTLEAAYLGLRQIQAGGDSAQNNTIRNNDRIHVFSKLDQAPQEVVTIHGEVNYPDEYQYEENMRVSDLILKAGSLTRSAYLLEAEVAQVDPNSSVKALKVPLNDLMNGTDSSRDILLHPDDHVFVRRIPDWQLGLLAEVRGEARFPGFYPIVKDSTWLSDVLQQAGGFTKDALLSEAKLIRHREPVLQDKEFERLKALTRDEMSDLEYEYFVMKQNSADVSEINVDFAKLVTRGDKSQDVILEDGDVITIPKSPRVVLVTGRVGKPGGVLYNSKADVGYYIAQAGGYSWDADRSRTKVIKVTGEIRDDEDIKSFSPGDRIWVPRKPDRDYWQIFRDTIMVAGQVATIYLVIHTATK
jgi:protein involved in polysaccharide export with SLBB domain